MIGRYQEIMNQNCPPKQSYMLTCLHQVFAGVPDDYKASSQHQVIPLALDMDDPVASHHKISIRISREI
jgi:hypothetical protein